MGLFRFYLAIVVVISHYRILVLNQYGAERDASYLFFSTLGLDAGHAVFLFYMISGFLISFALEKKYDFKAFTFYLGRMKRIFPLYLTLAFLTILVTGSNYLKTPFWPFGLGLLGGDWLLVFKDYPKEFWAHLPPLLNPAWSLSVEMCFYLVAPWLLRSKLCLPIFMASILVRWICLHFDLGTLYYYWFPPSLFFFLAGHYAGKFYEKMRIPNYLYLCILTMFFFLTWQGITAKYFDNPIFYSYAFCFFITLPFIFHKTKNIGWMNKAGDLSFPIYLTHTWLISSLFLGKQPIFAPKTFFSKGIPGLMALLLFVLITSILLHYLIELKAPIAFSYLKTMKNKLSKQNS